MFASKRFDFESFVREAHRAGASDIHIQTGSRPFFRINGDIVPVERGQITQVEIEDITKIVCDERSLAALRERNSGAVDRSFAIANLCRLRVSIARSMEGHKVVCRIIPNAVPTIEEFGMPKVLQSIAMEHSGFILVGGVTGSGKSTTIAAMIEHANRYQPKHVVTVEDPIEFIHEPKRCIFTRREINHHLDNFADGLRNALRQDPDIILVGEMRDRETMRAAIQAAETGHLVFATVHSAEVDDMPGRVIGSFPEMEQEQIRQQLANVSLAFIAQRLVKRKDGKGRVGAYEILLLNDAARNMIRSDKCHTLPNVMQTAREQGMITMTQYLVNLYKNGIIDTTTFVQNASNKEWARQVVLTDTGIDVSQASFLK
jgi:twitching motility protein PilT